MSDLVRFTVDPDRESLLMAAQDAPGGACIAYHGTSSIYEGQIEDHGLAAGRSPFDAATVERWVRMCQSIGFFGWDMGGGPVLAVFSASDRKRAGGRALLYLAETDSRAFTYSTREFSGGEVSRAIRKLGADLCALRDDPESRKRLYEEQRARSIEIVRADSPPCPVMRIKVDWLATELSACRSSYDLAKSQYDAHEWGVVYEVLLTDEDREYLQYEPAAGVRVYGSIPASRVRRRIRILPEQENEASQVVQMHAEQFRSHASKRLRDFIPQAGTGVPGNPGAPTKPLTRFVQNSDAGEDVALEIVAEFGSPFLRNLLKKHPGMRS